LPYLVGRWCAARSDKDVIYEREAFIRVIEKKGYKFWWVPVHPWWPKLLPHSWQAQRSLQGLAQARVP
jgi:hypothetical protein